MNQIPDGGGGPSGGPKEQRLFSAAYGASWSQIDTAREQVDTASTNLGVVAAQLDKLVPRLQDSWTSADGQAAAASTKDLAKALLVKRDQLDGTATALAKARHAVKAAQDYWSQHQPPPSPPTAPPSPTTPLLGPQATPGDPFGLGAQSQYNSDKAAYDSQMSSREAAMDQHYRTYQADLGDAGKSMAQVNSVEVWDTSAGQGGGGSSGGGGGVPPGGGPPAGSPGQPVGPGSSGNGTPSGGPSHGGPVHGGPFSNTGPGQSGPGGSTPPPLGGPSVDGGFAGVGGPVSDVPGLYGPGGSSGGVAGGLGAGSWAGAAAGVAGGGMGVAAGTLGMTSGRAGSAIAAMGRPGVDARATLGGKPAAGASGAGGQVRGGGGGAAGGRSSAGMVVNSGGTAGGRAGTTGGRNSGSGAGVRAGARESAGTAARSTAGTTGAGGSRTKGRQRTDDLSLVTEDQWIDEGESTDGVVR